MRIVRLTEFGERSITSSDPRETLLRGVDELDHDHGRQLFVLIEGKAYVGPNRLPVEALDAIEVEPGEALEIRVATSTVRFWKMEFVN